MFYILLAYYYYAYIMHYAWSTYHNCNNIIVFELAWLITVVGYLLIGE